MDSAPWELRAGHVGDVWYGRMGKKSGMSAAHADHPGAVHMIVPSAKFHTDLTGHSMFSPKPVALLHSQLCKWQCHLPAYTNQKPGICLDLFSPLNSSIQLPSSNPVPQSLLLAVFLQVLSYRKKTTLGFYKICLFVCLFV